MDLNVQMIGTALVETIKSGLGEGFTNEVSDSWSFAIGFVATNVTKGLEQ